jgi:hypothetical protein
VQVCHRLHRWWQIISGLGMCAMGQHINKVHEKSRRYKMIVAAIVIGSGIFTKGRSHRRAKKLILRVKRIKFLALRILIPIKFSLTTSK